MEEKFVYILESRTTKEIKKILLWVGKSCCYLLHKLFVPAIVYDQKIHRSVYQY
jgi:hypothetical protein